FFLTCLLVAPFHLSLSLTKKDVSSRQEFRVAWLKGFLTVVMSSDEGGRFLTVMIFGLRIHRRCLEEKEEEKMRRVDWRSLLESWRLLQSLFDPLMRVVGALLKSVSFEELSCDLEAGLPDPAFAGVLFGYLYAFRALVQTAFPRGRISLNPVFTRSVFNYSLRSTFRLTLWRLVVPMLRLFTKRETRALMKTFRQM
ncbi:MAG: DUF2953 domain-containing protein, partial [Candidatus Bathyarchaeia archaeon]